MFTYKVTIRNEAERKFNTTRLEKIKKLLGNDVIKNESYIEWKNETSEINIYPKHFYIESNEVSIIKNLVKEISSILEYNNIIFIECNFCIIMPSEKDKGLSDSISLINNIVKLNIPYEPIKGCITLKTEFIALVGDSFYTISFSLKPNNLEVKISDNLQNINDIDNTFQEIEELLKKLVDNLILNNEVKTNE